MFSGIIINFILFKLFNMTKIQTKLMYLLDGEEQDQKVGKCLWAHLIYRGQLVNSSQNYIKRQLKEIIFRFILIMEITLNK